MNPNRNIRVLIAEDDPMVGEMIQGMLEDKGYQVVGRAVNGAHAVTLATSTSPNVILMDLEMPVLNGIQAAKQIIDVHPVPIVVLTAYESPALIEQASAVGVGAYLIKPPDDHEIDRAITVALSRFNDLMDLRRLNQELEQTLAKVKRLSGLLPICANCKKIRNDLGYWQEVEIYIREHANVEFSHGLCPSCLQMLYPDFDKGDFS